MSRSDTQIGLSIAVTPAQFLDRIGADGQCTVTTESITTTAPAPGTWSLYLVGRKLGEPLDMRMLAQSAIYERERATGISIKAFLAVEPRVEETWVSKNIFAEFWTRGLAAATPSLSVAVRAAYREANASSHVHLASSDANGALLSVREIFGNFITPIFEFRSSGTPIILKCTAVICPSEAVDAGFAFASTVRLRMLPVAYVNAELPQRPLSPRGPTPDSPSERDYLSLFDGEPFQYDPFTDSEVHFGVKVYHCHRSVLKSAGSVFKAQLTAPLEGGRRNVFNVDLPSVQLEEAAVDAFMMALYRTQSLYGVDSVRHLIQLYHLMDYYGADRAAVICAERLGGMVSNETAKDLLVFADNFNLEPLLENCLRQCAALGPSAWAEGDWATLSREHPDLMPRIIAQMAQDRERDQRRIHTLEGSRGSDLSMNSGAQSAGIPMEGSVAGDTNSANQNHGRRHGHQQGQDRDARAEARRARAMRRVARAGARAIRRQAKADARAVMQQGAPLRAMRREQAHAAAAAPAPGAGGPGPQPGAALPQVKPGGEDAGAGPSHQRPARRPSAGGPGPQPGAALPRVKTEGEDAGAGPSHQRPARPSSSTGQGCSKDDVILLS